MDVEQLLKKARETNAKRDATERAMGYATPAGAGYAVLFNTAIDAIRAGISVEDWNCIAEGLAMLYQFKDMFVVVRLEPLSKQ